MKEGDACKSKHPEPKQKVNLGICNFQHDHKESANLFVDDVQTHDTKAVELLLTSSSANGMEGAASDGRKHSTERVWHVYPRKWVHRKIGERSRPISLIDKKARKGK